MPVRLTSIAAYRELVDAGRHLTIRGQIIAVVAKRANMSLREIQHKLVERTGNYIDVGTISARVKELKDAGILAEEALPRKCLVKGRTIRPVYVVV